MTPPQNEKDASAADSSGVHGDGLSWKQKVMGAEPPDAEMTKLETLGYSEALQRNRSLMTLLFQTLAIAAIPYGEGSALIYAVYGGGPLSIFVGWIVVCVLDECIAISLSEIASRYPTSAGPAYWSFQLARTESQKKLLSFITGWIWLIGNWTITLSVNFGFAELIAATVALYNPSFDPTAWQLLLIFYACTLLTFAICVCGNRFLPMVDALCAGWTIVTILVVLLALSVVAGVGRHSADYALGGYTEAFSGWSGFTFFIGLLPPAYTFAALGMVTSMSEEVQDPEVQMPKAVSLCIPIAGTYGFFFILPICFTLPPLGSLLNAPVAQALPYVFHRVLRSPGGAVGLMILILGVTLFCSISITTAASRTTWAFARDRAIPFSSIWVRVFDRFDVPFWSLALVTIVQLLLGLINLGSTSAFTAFISVGVFGLAVSYGIPIALSLLEGRREVSKARWKVNNILGGIINVVAILWILFELILFSMPTALPVTATSMNYASVVFFGFLAISAVYWSFWARKVYVGPPKSDGL